MVNTQLFQTLKGVLLPRADAVNPSWRRHTPSARATSWRNWRPPAA